MVSRAVSLAVYWTVPVGEKFPRPAKKSPGLRGTHSTAQYTIEHCVCIGGKCSYGGKKPENMIFKKVLDIRKKLCYSIKALVAE